MSVQCVCTHACTNVCVYLLAAVIVYDNSSLNINHLKFTYFKVLFIFFFHPTTSEIQETSWRKTLVYILMIDVQIEKQSERKFCVLCDFGSISKVLGYV